MKFIKKNGRWILEFTEEEKRDILGVILREMSEDFYHVNTPKKVKKRKGRIIMLSDITGAGTLGPLIIKYLDTIIEEADKVGLKLKFLFIRRDGLIKKIFAHSLIENFPFITIIKDRIISLKTRCILISERKYKELMSSIEKKS